MFIHKMGLNQLKQIIIINLDDLTAGAARDLALNHLNCKINQILDD